jgi:hypothetical protein
MAKLVLAWSRRHRLGPTDVFRQVDACVRWDNDAYISHIDGDALIVLGADIHEAQLRADAAIQQRHPHTCEGHCGEWIPEPCHFTGVWPAHGLTIAGSSE